MACSRVVLKKLLRTSVNSATTRHGSAAVASLLSRTAYAATGSYGGFFSDVFNRFSSSSTKVEGNPAEGRYLRSKTGEGDEQGPKLSLKFILEKTKEKGYMENGFHDRMFSECANVALCAVAFVIPSSLPAIFGLVVAKALTNSKPMAKRNKNRLYYDLRPEEDKLDSYNYVYEFDNAGLHVFVNVNGLRKQDLKPLICDDLLLVATNEDSPPGTRMQHVIKLPAMYFDPDKITANIVNGGDLKITFPFEQRKEVTRPTWFPVKLN